MVATVETKVMAGRYVPRALSAEALRKRWCEVSRLMGSQRGVVSRAQAKSSLGLPRSAIHRRLRSGEWRRSLPNVYVSASSSQDGMQRLKAVELWAGEGAALSHRTALYLWGGNLSDDVIHVSTACRRRPRAGICLHRTSRLVPEHLQSLHGLTVTCPARTLVDMAALLGVSTDDSREVLNGWVDDFLERGLVTLETLAAFLQQHTMRRVPGRWGLTVLLRKRRKGEPRTRADIFETWRRAAIAHDMPPPFRIANALGVQAGWLVGYPGCKLAFELLAENLPVTVTEEAKTKRERTFVRGLGWEVLALSWESLTRGERRKTMRQMRRSLLEWEEHWRPPPHPQLPSYSPQHIRRHLEWLFQKRRLPPVLARDWAQLSVLAQQLESGDYQRLAPEQVSALVPLLERFNGIPSYALDPTSLPGPRAYILNASGDGIRRAREVYLARRRVQFLHESERIDHLLFQFENDPLTRDR